MYEGDKDNLVGKGASASRGVVSGSCVCIVKLSFILILYAYFGRGNFGEADGGLWG